MTILVEVSNMLEGVGSVMGDVDATHMNGVLNRPNSGNHVNNPTSLMKTIDSSDLIDQVCMKEDEPEYSISASVQVVVITRPISRADFNSATQGRKQTEAKADPTHLMPTSDSVSLPQPRSITNSLPP
ncbi:hypothetical protein CR513_03635, partial [Mucuna pruriens]